MNVEEGSLEGLPYLAIGDGPPLIVFSGLTPAHENPTGVARRFELQVLKPFAKHFRVYEVNRRPGLAAGATMSDIAQDYAGALKSRFESPVDIIGISTGGSVALQFAIDHPDLVRRLVIASSACRLGPYGRDAQQRVAQLAAAGKTRDAQRAIGEAVVQSALARRVAGATFWLLGSILMGRTDDPSDMIITITAEDTFDATPDLHRITAPTLVVGGERDGFYAPELFRATAEGIPNGRLALYEGKGHVGALSGKRFHNEVIAFLAEP